MKSDSAISLRRFDCDPNVSTRTLSIRELRSVFNLKEFKFK